MLRVDKQKPIIRFQHNSRQYKLVHEQAADGYVSYVILLITPGVPDAPIDRFYQGESEFEFLDNLIRFGHPYPSHSSIEYGSRTSYRLRSITADQIEVEMKPRPEANWQLIEVTEIPSIFYTLYQLLSENVQPGDEVQ